MGFLDVLTGGGAIKTGDAEALANRSRQTVSKMYNQNTAAIQPYLAGGTGAYQKLSRLLGVAEGTVKSKDDLTFELARNYLPKTATLTDRSGAYGQQFTDEATGTRYVIDGGQIFQKSKSGGKWAVVPGTEGFGAAVDQAYNQSLQNAEGAEDYGSLLDPFTIEDYEQSPNYQFNLDEGKKALDRAAAARGNYFSPAAVQELLGYSQNLASNEWLNSYNMDAQNKSRTYDMLMGSSGIGQTATGQQVAVNQDFGTNMTDLNAQLAQLGLARQADKAAKRQSAFGNLMSLASLAGNPFGSIGGGGLPMSNMARGAGWSGNTFVGY